MDRREYLLLSVAALSGLVVSSPARSLETNIRDVAHAVGLTFGLAVNTYQLDDPVLARFIASEAAVIVPEVEHKFGITNPAQDVADFARPDRIADFAAKHGMQLRGHTMVWHRNIPEWAFSAIADDWDAVLTQRIDSMARRYPITTWDVCNEVVADDGRSWRTDSAWYQAAGSIDYVRRSFELAREKCPPGTGLAYCDFGTENGNWAGAKREKILELLEMLAADGLVDSFAAQGHINVFDDGYRFDDAGWRDFLGAVAALGLRLDITELDVGNYSGAKGAELADMAAELTERVLTPWVEARAGDHLIIWGVRDDLSWRNAAHPDFEQRPLPWDKSGRPNPMLTAIVRAISSSPAAKNVF